MKVTLAVVCALMATMVLSDKEYIYRMKGFYTGTSTDGKPQCKLILDGCVREAPSKDCVRIGKLIQSEKYESGCTFSAAKTKFTKEEGEAACGLSLGGLAFGSATFQHSAYVSKVMKIDSAIVSGSYCQVNDSDKVTDNYLSAYFENAGSTTEDKSVLSLTATSQKGINFINELII